MAFGYIWMKVIVVAACIIGNECQDSSESESTDNANVEGVPTYNVDVDCQSNYPEHKPIVEISWTGSGHQFKAISVEGCPQVYDFLISPTVFTFDLETCPYLDMGSTFRFWASRSNVVFAQVDDVLISGRCKLVDDDITVTANVDAQQTSVPTALIFEGEVLPYGYAYVGFGAECATIASLVMVRQKVNLCIGLDLMFRADGGGHFDAAVKKISVENLNLAQEVVLTENYCKVLDGSSWQELTSTGPGKSEVQNFAMIAFIGDTNEYQLLRFHFVLDVCKLSEGLGPNCDIDYDDLCSPAAAAARKRRSVGNETDYDEVEMTYDITVTRGIPIPGKSVTGNQDGDTPQTETKDDVTDVVRIKKAFFYGFLAFFVVALMMAILASCYLFMKYRMADKQAAKAWSGFAGKQGCKNPSFRA